MIKDPKFDRVAAVSNSSVQGATLEECLQKAYEYNDRFFKSRGKYEIVEILARPSIQAMGGGVILLEATIEAQEVMDDTPSNS